MFAGKKSAQIREILISESAWEEMTCLFAPSLINGEQVRLALYAEHHPDAYRRIESVAEVKGKLRVLDLKRQDVRNAIAVAENAESLFSSNFAGYYQ
ncbi:hypothetical protein QRZ06_01465 [Enterobacter asburiae]|nr:hypothetical protein [Enterobacter asburiae]MDL4611236.1 hypothetical protein [Enterobacter asburiae]